VSYSGRSPLCPGKSRAIPPLAGLSVEESTLTAGEKSAEGMLVVPKGEMRARTVEGKITDLTRAGNARVKAFTLPER